MSLSPTRHTTKPGQGFFTNGASSGTQYADFDASYQPINGESSDATASRYTVQQGDTLETIAQRVWGDGNFWYLIADANGLAGDSQLTVGMDLIIPNRKEQISIFLGHLPKDSDATTSIYAPYEPEYCSEALAAIEDVMSEIRRHLKRANIDQPILDIDALAKAIPSKTTAGIGDAKREQIRHLILSGLPHAEVAHRTGTSSGTVSLVRKEMREVIPLYRNSESGLCVPLRRKFGRR
jgi:LysM repeat protein